MRRIPIYEVMTIIRCTIKLLKELGINPTIIPDQPSGLSDWHANLLRVERKRYVLFANDLTLYSFLIRMVKISSSAGFCEQFRLGLFKSLMSDGLNDPQVMHILGSQGSIVLSKTSSRSVLGSMNDLAFQLKYMVQAKGGLSMVDLAEINRQLNRIPMGAIKYKFSIDELRRRLG